MLTPFSSEDLGRVFDARTLTEGRTLVLLGTVEVTLQDPSIAVGVCDLLVVDETSMVGVPLMRSLLQVLPDRAALLIVVDVDQLPSVGPGRVLADIIGSDGLPARSGRSNCASERSRLSHACQSWRSRTTTWRSPA